MIYILFFAKYREQLGLAKLELQPASVQSIAELVESLKQVYGDRVSFLNDRNLLISVNQEIATSQTAVRSGDEVAFLPPVTGG